MTTTPTDHHPLFAALRRSVLATELSDAQVDLLAARCERRDLPDGTVLVPEGRSDSHLYLLLHGTIAVVRGHGGEAPNEMFTLQAGDTVGELSFLDDHQHYATLVARGAATVVALRRQEFEALLDVDPRAVYGVMRAIVRRVHQIQHRLSAQANELANYVYKQHGRY
jgi:CRP-like cAMP-binding protein